MQEKYLDTYFFDSNFALEIALKNNQAETRNPNIKGLQICYYNGEKLKDAPRNCIHLPLDKIYSYFITTNHRFPQFVSFKNTDFSQEDRESFNKSLTEILQLSIIANNKIVNKYYSKVKKNTPDFSKKKIRVYVSACRETVVMQHISKSIAKSFQNMGCEVKFYIQKNDMEACGALANLKTQYKFNPHIIFNINHFNNEFIHSSVHNFVWFQDTMKVLQEDEAIFKRKNDYVFHLTKGLGTLLKDKKINSMYQNFCIDSDLYKKRKNIKRENKIIYIGNSYFSRIENQLDKKICNESSYEEVKVE